MLCTIHTTGHTSRHGLSFLTIISVKKLNLKYLWSVEIQKNQKSSESWQKSGEHSGEVGKD